MRQFGLVGCCILLALFATAAFTTQASTEAEIALEKAKVSVATVKRTVKDAGEPGADDELLRSARKDWKEAKNDLDVAKKAGINDTELKILQGDLDDTKRELDHTVLRKTIRVEIEKFAKALEDDKSKTRPDHLLIGVLAFLLLIFGGFVLLFQKQLINSAKARWAPFSVVRFFGLTLIVTAAMIILVISSLGGEESEKFVTAIIGLLGAIAGYLLGKDSRVPDDINPQSSDALTKCKVLVEIAATAVKDAAKAGADKNTLEAASKAIDNARKELEAAGKLSGIDVKTLNSISKDLDNVENDFEKVKAEAKVETEAKTDTETEVEKEKEVETKAETETKDKAEAKD